MTFKPIGLQTWLARKRKGAAAPILGERELAVLELLWGAGELTAQQVLESLGHGDTITLNTVQSTLERLFRKQVIDRRKEGRKYVYRALQSKAALISELLEDISQEIAKGDTDSMVSAFQGFLDARDYDGFTRNAADAAETEGGDGQC